ncbi:MAG: metal ABC transporter permease [Verrucomicrobiae bacterium]|nr:metal ABC transporter permease [Verrucomicrobiae bacterium]
MMLAILDLGLWAPVMLGGALAGASSGALGVYIVGMRIPFLGVCVSHAALAGAVFGALAGLSGPWMLLPALAGAMISALALGLARPERLRTDNNTVMNLLFTGSMGLAFLGLGLFPVFGKSDHDVRALLWGSLNYCRWHDVWLMAGGAALLFLFLALTAKEMRAILFSRTDAAAAGIHVTLVWTIFLVLVALVLTVNFQTVGGLMIFSLMTNPAAAAFLLVRGGNRTLAVAAALGAFSGLAGFIISALTDLPTGATIVLLSAGVVGAAALYRARQP